MILENISATVLAKNSEKHLKEVLNALLPFGEVILYDTGSTDKTREIAQAFPNVRVLQAPFIGFGPTHNKASSAAKNNWILSIDSDEIATPELVKALREETENLNAVYSFPRHNYFNGKFIKWCGWYPDRQIKLYNKTKTQFSQDQVHETVLSKNMSVINLSAPILHYSYGSVSDFLSKMQSYSSLFAEQYQGKKKSSLLKALSHGAFAFFKSYVLKKGFLGGREGYIISAYNGHTAYYKYLKLHEANQAMKKTSQRKAEKSLRH